MAICAGCSSGGCTCVVDGVTITGAGIAGDPFVAAASGGGGGPFIIVASATTAPARQAIAHYVCDGIADQVEINQAVVDLTSGHLGFDWGGTVYLLEGAYFTSAPIDLKYSVNLQGTGHQTTLIYFDGKGDAGPRTHPGNPYGNDYVIIKVGAGQFVSDFYINQFNYSGTGFRGGIRLDGELALATRVHVILDSNPVAQPAQNAAIRMNSRYSIVSESRIEAFDGTAVDLSADQNYCVVHHNVIRASLGVNGDGTQNMIVSDNLLFGGGPNGATPYGYSTNASTNWVPGCGIVVWAGGGEGSMIIDNRVEGCAKHGIALDSVSRVSVTDNQVLNCSQNIFNTYDGIIIRNNSYGNNIQGNRVYGESSHRYGINVANQATLPVGQNNPSYNTLVANNDLLNSAITAAFNDSGVDTVTLGGNRI